MDTLLVTGVDTVVGANLALTLADRYHCLGLGQRRRYAPSGCEALPLESGLGQHPAAAALLNCRADWVIHCGPAARSSWDVPLPSASTDDAVAEAVELARVAQRLGVPLAVISTDAVFVGPRLFHEEIDRPTADTQLARWARRIEEALVDSRALVVRTHAYGWSPIATEPGFVDAVVDAIEQGRPCPQDALCYATPILAGDLAEFLHRARELDLRGLYHLTGAERTHPFRFANELAAALDLPPSVAAASPITAAAAGAPVVETSLNTRRARRDLGRPMPFLREGLERLAAQRTNGYRDRLRSTAEPAVQVWAA